MKWLLPLVVLLSGCTVRELQSETPCRVEDITIGTVHIFHRIDCEKEPTPMIGRDRDESSSN